MPEIALALLALRPDIVALAEFRPSVGGQIAAALADHGLQHTRTTNPPPRTNGLLLASRLPLLHITTPAPPPPLQRRWLLADIPDLALTLAAVHLPELERAEAAAHGWKFLLDLAHARRHAPTIILGDLNAWRPGIDGPDRPNTAAASLGKLATWGFHDAWRLANHHAETLSSQEPGHTWISPWGDRFRLDYALVSAPLRDRVSACRACQGPLSQRLSDHAPLLLELDTTTPRAP